MRIIFIGCVESSKVFLEAVLSVKGAEVVGIVTKKESKFNSDFVSLDSIADKNGIPCYIYEKQNSEQLITWAQSLNADIIYCFGWSYLLPENLIFSAKMGAIGYHPALLPANRGRHPIIWALVLGLEKTGSSFFFLDKGADSGDIISQEVVTIADNDTAASLYAKLMEIGVKQVVCFTGELVSGNYNRIPQDETKASSWRKRGYKDGIIDWRMSARSIYNLVRALTHPYVGACFIYEEQEIKVWTAKVVDEISAERNIEPGKIVAASDDEITVQCGQGSICIFDCGLKDVRKGDYLI